jgi:hypothetical protein
VYKKKNDSEYAALSSFWESVVSFPKFETINVLKHHVDSLPYGLYLLSEISNDGGVVGYISTVVNIVVADNCSANQRSVCLYLELY